jgi:hypothetical protein
LSLSQGGLEPRGGGDVGERINARALLLFDDQAEVTTAYGGPEDPQRVPVARLVADTGIPRARLAGAKLVAVIGDDGELER